MKNTKPFPKPIVTLEKIRKAGYSGFDIDFQNEEKPVSNLEFFLIEKSRKNNNIFELKI